jgi:hypothetical protein
MSKKDTKAAAAAEDLLGTPAAKKVAKPAAKKAAAKAEKPAKPAAKKAAKADDAEDLLGTPAKKAAKKEPKADKPQRVKEKVVYAEGEREEIAKKVKTAVRKEINSKELAAKLGIATRKLRPVLYRMAKQNAINIALGGSRVLGMTVSPAAKA